MKKCTRCKTTKPLEGFSKAKNRKDGRQGHCKACHKEIYHQNKEARKQKRKEYAEANKEKIQAYHKGYRERNRTKLKVEQMWRGAKRRAERKELPFDIELEDLVIPDNCPVLGMPLEIGEGHVADNSATLDRHIPEKGYVKGNITIISCLANRIKNSATSEEILKVYEWVKQKENEHEQNT